MARTPSRLEQAVAQAVRILLCDVRSGEDIPFPTVCFPDIPRERRDQSFYGLMGDLDRFIPEVICEVEHCPTLDGMTPYRIRKLAPLEADIVGACWYIEEQRLAPFYLQFVVSRHVDKLDWCYCCLGELGLRGEITWPASTCPTTVGIKAALRIREIRWKHCVEYGERGPSVPKRDYF